MSQETKGQRTCPRSPSSEEVELRRGAKFSAATAHEPPGASRCLRRNAPGMQKEGGDFQGLINTRENIKAQQNCDARGSGGRPTAEDRGRAVAGASLGRGSCLGQGLHGAFRMEGEALQQREPPGPSRGCPQTGSPQRGLAGRGREGPVCTVFGAQLGVRVSFHCLLEHPRR